MSAVAKSPSPPVMSENGELEVVKMSVSCFWENEAVVVWHSFTSRAALSLSFSLQPARFPHGAYQTCRRCARPMLGTLRSLENKQKENEKVNSFLAAAFPLPSRPARICESNEVGEGDRLIAARLHFFPTTRETKKKRMAPSTLNAPSATSATTVDDELGLTAQQLADFERDGAFLCRDDFRKLRWC